MVIELFLFIITTVDILFPFVCCVHVLSVVFILLPWWCAHFLVLIFVLVWWVCCGISLGAFVFIWLLGSDSAASVFAAISVVAYS